MASIVNPYASEKRLEIRGEQLVRPFGCCDDWTALWVLVAMRVNGKRRTTLNDDPLFAIGVSGSSGYQQPGGTGAFAGLARSTLVSTWGTVAAGSGYKYGGGQDSGFSFGVQIKRNGTVTQSGKFVEYLFEEQPSDGAKVVFPVAFRAQKLTSTSIRISAGVVNATSAPTLMEFKNATFARSWTAAREILKLNAVSDVDFTSLAWLSELTHFCLLWRAVTRWECGAIYIRKEA